MTKITHFQWVFHDSKRMRWEKQCILMMNKICYLLGSSNSELLDAPCTLFLDAIFCVADDCMFSISGRYANNEVSGQQHILRWILCYFINRDSCRDCILAIFEASLHLDQSFLLLIRLFLHFQERTCAWEIEENVRRHLRCRACCNAIVFDSKFHENNCKNLQKTVPVETKQFVKNDGQGILRAHGYARV